jgi:uncharacterized protein YegP (UPF0339 family)
MLRLSSFLPFALVAAVFATACSGEGGSPTEGASTQDDIRGGNVSFETVTGLDGSNYFQILGRKGELILRSKGMSTPDAVLRALGELRGQGTDPDNYELLETTDERHYFALLAANDEVLAWSPSFFTKAAAEETLQQLTRLLPILPREPSQVNRTPRIEVFQAPDGQHYFHVRAASGEIALHSEGYSSEAEAAFAIGVVRMYGRIKDDYEIVAMPNGVYTFRFKATDTIVGSGPIFASKSNAESALDGIVGLLSTNRDLPIVTAR